MTHTTRCGVIAAVMMMMMGLAVPPAGSEVAGDLRVPMARATPSGPGEPVGDIVVAGSEAGAAFRLDLHGLPPGRHGFHVHENAECEPILLNGVRIPAGAAGGHWDPERAELHAGPLGSGHLGDLPVIEVAADGSATQTVTAPRIRDIEMLRGHALVVDSGGDSYSETPKRLGGGGLHLACGSIP